MSILTSVGLLILGGLTYKYGSALLSHYSKGPSTLAAEIALSLLEKREDWVTTMGFIRRKDGLHVLISGGARHISVSKGACDTKIDKVSQNFLWKAYQDYLRTSTLDELFEKG